MGIDKELQRIKKLDAISSRLVMDMLRPKKPVPAPFIWRQEWKRSLLQAAICMKLQSRALLTLHDELQSLLEHPNAEYLDRGGRRLLTKVEKLQREVRKLMSDAGEKIVSLDELAEKAKVKFSQDEAAAFGLTLSKEEGALWKRARGSLLASFFLAAEPAAAILLLAGGAHFQTWGHRGQRISNALRNLYPAMFKP